MSLFSQDDYAPLAARMRPAGIDDYAGQTHLLGEGKPLRKIENPLRIPSLDETAAGFFFSPIILNFFVRPTFQPSVVCVGL